MANRHEAPGRDGNPVLDLTQDLIRRPSVTPEDAGCQALLIERLERLGFAVTILDAGGVRNFYAELGSGRPCLAFAGHTDVVPPGELAAWQSPPFEPVIRNGLLFGRGAADMKASLAAMIVATERFLARQPTPSGRIAFLITSDEEGEARHGTRHIVEHLRSSGIGLDYCIVGEPSSSEALGDTLRNGRRGSLTGTLNVHGIQGHVAYPNAARNPIHEAAPFLKALCEEAFDQGNAHYPPTSLQVANIRAGAGAVNVIPGELAMDFNIRYSTVQTAEGLKDRIAKLVAQHGLDATLIWHLSGEPFLTKPGRLTSCVRQAVLDELGLDCALSTSGGTSDGRFIAPLGCELVELGPVNATIHKVDECVAVADLDRLARVYERILAALLT